MKKPLLSILIPNYNHAKYLPECLTSVLQTDAEDIEIFVVDDASTDNSVEVIESFAKKDSRVKLVRNAVNQGVNKTCNAGLALVSGEFVFGLSADDKALPTFFTKVLPILRDHPEIDLCTSDFASFTDENPGKIEVSRLSQTDEPYLILLPDETIEKFQKTSFWIPGNSSIMRTTWALRYGGYQEALKQHSDFYLFHKIALSRPIAYIPMAIAAMRIVAGSYSATCLANSKIRLESQCNLLNLVLQDELRDRFVKSTLLAPMIKRLKYKVIRTPRYWRFLFPLIRKKIRKGIRFGLLRKPHTSIDAISTQ